MYEAVSINDDKNKDPQEIFGHFDRYAYKKVLGQGAYGIVW